MATTTKGYTVNYSDMKLPELKSLAKKLKIKGFSTMKKADLVTAIEQNDKAKNKPESFIDSIKAAFANAREHRKNAGRKAGSEAVLTLKTLPAEKIMNYRLQRGSVTAKLTAKQARRVRKSERIALG